ncbi:MAG: hypothetical protein V1875_08980 [Candidatus Altiarchaeota archaeon]
MINEKNYVPDRIPPSSIPPLRRLKGVVFKASSEDSGTFTASLILGKGSIPCVASTFEELLDKSRETAKENSDKLNSSGLNPEGPIKVVFDGFLRRSSEEGIIPQVTMQGAKISDGYAAEHVVDEVPIVVRRPTFKELCAAIISETDRVLTTPPITHHFGGKPNILLRLTATV